jgi:glucokinase
VIGAGTGLGVALRAWNGSHYRALATEAGHADFAPADATQQELADTLRARHYRVYNELLLSGNGLLRTYEFECARHQRPPVHRSAAEVSAAVNNDAIAAASVGLFLRIYGTVAGNLALSTGARGGVYVAGGIALHLLTQLSEGPFLDAFNDKPTMGQLLRETPVTVVTHPNPGLLGALRCACDANDD